MQKLIGSILVLTATAGAGYLYGEGLKDYLRQMEYLRYIAGMIRGQLEYTGTHVAGTSDGCISENKKSHIKAGWNIPHDGLRKEQTLISQKYGKDAWKRILELPD